MISPSRTYVALCYKTNFDGMYFRKFKLPDDEINNSMHASWYFLNRLNLTACIEGSVPFEDFNNFKEGNGNENN
jgi:hypothetical protein